MESGRKLLRNGSAFLDQVLNVICIFLWDCSHPHIMSLHIIHIFCSQFRTTGYETIICVSEMGHQRCWMPSHYLLSFAIFVHRNLNSEHRPHHEHSVEYNRHVRRLY